MFSEPSWWEARHAPGGSRGLECPRPPASGGTGGDQESPPRKCQRPQAEAWPPASTTHRLRASSVTAIHASTHFRVDICPGRRSAASALQPEDTVPPPSGHTHPPESSSRHPSPGRHPGSPFSPSLLPTWAHSSHPAVTEASGTVGEAHPPGLPRNAGHPSDRSDPRGRTGTYAEEVWESWGAPGVLEGTLLPAHRPALTVTLRALVPG